MYWQILFKGYTVGYPYVMGVRAMQAHAHLDIN